MIVGPAAVFAFIIGYKIGMRYAHSSHAIVSLIVHCAAAGAAAFIAAASAHIFDSSLQLDAAVVVMLSAAGIGMLIGTGAGLADDEGR